MSETPIDTDTDTEAYSPILKADDEQQIVTGTPLVPGKPDRRGDLVSAENIEHVAHDYLATHRHVDEMHDGINRDYSVVESYTAPHELDIGGKKIRKGTWIVSVQLDDDAWQKVKDGTFQGFSIEGRGRRHPEGSG